MSFWNFFLYNSTFELEIKTIIEVINKIINAAAPTRAPIARYIPLY